MPAVPAAERGGAATTFATTTSAASPTAVHKTVRWTCRKSTQIAANATRDAVAAHVGRSASHDVARIAAHTNATAVPSSTSGYRADIADPHPRQRPRWITQENNGMFSDGFSTRSQVGQCDGGVTIDSPLGTRQITTFKNDPTHNPSTAPTPTATSRYETPPSIVTCPVCPHTLRLAIPPAAFLTPLGPPIP